MADYTTRIPAWGVFLLLAGSVTLSVLLVNNLMKRYKKRWPW